MTEERYVHTFETFAPVSFLRRDHRGHRHGRCERDPCGHEGLYFLGRSCCCPFFRSTRLSTFGPDTRLGEEMSSVATHKAATKLFHVFLSRKIPVLHEDKYKGQSGRIGVIGGSEIYVGAPFYAGMSALKCGADLLYLFTANEAAPAIKTFSPELMVEAIYNCADTAQPPEVISNKAVSKLNHLHSLCIGPGLGRHDHVFKGVKEIVVAAQKMRTPIVFDADGLFMVTQDIPLIQGYGHAMLTPNIVEFKRLCEALRISPPSLPFSLEWIEPVQSVANALGNIVVLKGYNDVISNGRETLVCTEPGSLRRCGGQGDVLAGVMSLASAWACMDSSPSKEGKGTSDGDAQSNHLLSAAYFSCVVTKRASRMAFNKKGRSFSTPDIFSELGIVLEELVPSPKVV